MHEFSEQLIMFPFVPYAVSLSLSIAYCEMRHSKAPMYRGRARDHFKANCEVLQRLGEAFWSASTIAAMGNSILEEMDRVYSTVADAHLRSSRRDSVERNSIRDDGGSAPTTLSPGNSKYI